jgi:hypothetical protein
MAGTPGGMFGKPELLAAIVVPVGLLDVVLVADAAVVLDCCCCLDEGFDPAEEALGKSTLRDDTELAVSVKPLVVILLLYDW